ncbi:MAG: hypothetical protein IID61_12915 [SAR324 cluster bacterium]|nr:hypothetical protein [SAR324 cluster bacterium]
MEHKDGPASESPPFPSSSLPNTCYKLVTHNYGRFAESHFLFCSVSSGSYYIVFFVDDQVRYHYDSGSTPDWIADAKILLSQMPIELQDTIHKYETLENYKAPEYLAAVDSFYSRHLSRKNWPYIPNVECENVPSFNEHVYNFMWGPTEFHATGTLLEFDVTDRLQEIDVPVLFIAGQFDEARPERVAEFQKLIPGSKLTVILDAAHETLSKKPDEYRNVIEAFFDAVEDKKRHE